MKENFFSYQGKKLYYREVGNGPAMILLHGYPFDGRIWLPFAHKLAGDFRLIIPDLPGFGKSQKPDTQLNMNVMAWNVSALIKHLGLGQFVVAGHSMGGYVALALAAEKMSAGLAGLVLFHSQAAGDDEAARLKRNESITLIETNKEAFVKAFVPGLYGKTVPAEAADHLATALSQSTETMASAMAGLRDRPDQLDWLPTAEFPMLFILGKADSRMPAERILTQAARVPHAEVLLLEGVGHMGFVEAGDTIAPVLRDFAKRCLAGE
ncbi:MAG: alpha/beta hydrolase [Bacteroidetes bacterium]|nr:alpha/beta hydrolase [Bacteroidota bacterium]